MGPPKGGATKMVVTMLDCWRTKQHDFPLEKGSRGRRTEKERERKRESERVGRQNKRKRTIETPLMQDSCFQYLPSHPTPCIGEWGNRHTHRHTKSLSHTRTHSNARVGSSICVQTVDIQYTQRKALRNSSCSDRLFCVCMCVRVWWWGGRVHVCRSGKPCFQQVLHLIKVSGAWLGADV